MCVGGEGGSSSPTLSVLFTPPLYHGSIFVHYLPKPRASPPTGPRVTDTWLLELRAGEGMWIPGQISLPHFLEAQGKGFQEPAGFNSQPAVGVDRLGAETVGDALSPTSLASFPRTQAVGWGWGWGWRIASLPFPVTWEVTCQRKLPLNFLAPLPYSSATELSGAERKLASPHFSLSSAEML